MNTLFGNMENLGRAREIALEIIKANGPQTAIEMLLEKGLKEDVRHASFFNDYDWNNTPIVGLTGFDNNGTVEVEFKCWNEYSGVENFKNILEDRKMYSVGLNDYGVFLLTVLAEYFAE